MKPQLPDRVLVLLSDDISAPDGVNVREPVYGAPARWISPDDQEDAALQGLTVVSPPEVLATHLLEVIRANLSRLLSLRGLRRLLDEFVTLTDPQRAEANKRLLDDLIPEKCHKIFCCRFCGCCWKSESRSAICP